MVSHHNENEERLALTSADIQRITAPSLSWQCLFCEGFCLPLSSGLVTIVTARSVFGWIQANWLLHLQRMPQSLWHHTTADNKEGEQQEERRSVGASSCNSVDVKSQRVQFLKFMMMMMMVIPFSTTTSSSYPVPSTVLKLWITIMQLWKTFPSSDRKLKENRLNLMSAALHCLWFHY